MMVIAMTFTGMMVLYKNCEPFDVFRTVLMLTMAVAGVVAVVFLPDLFGVGKMSLTDLFFSFTVILASYFIASILMRIMRGAKLLQ